MRKARDDVTQGANDVKTQVLQTRGKLSTHKTVTERAKRHSETSPGCDVNTQLKERVTGLQRAATEPVGDKEVRAFTFTLDPEVVARIERDLSQLGTVTFTPVTSVNMVVSVRSDMSEVIFCED